jgi:uncharacterized damage-inducible protein DinB
MLTQLRELFTYNRWANERLLDVCATLAPEQVGRDLGGSFPSVWMTLTHIYAGENTWLARWQGTATGQAPDLDGVTDIAGLRAKWDALWERQSQFIGDATESDVRCVIPIVFRNGTSMDQQMAATMRHTVNHSTYHRGQVTNFLRILGAQPVPLDLVYYYRDFPPAG